MWAHKGLDTVVYGVQLCGSRWMWAQKARAEVGSGYVKICILARRHEGGAGAAGGDVREAGGDLLLFLQLRHAG